MRLTEWFSQEKIADSGKVQTQTVNNRTGEQVNRQIRSLVPGQTLRGEVVSREGNNAQIRLLQDILIDAKVDADIRLELGQNITFQVKTNGQVLNLSPLFTNMATEGTVLKALDMASLPANEHTMTMTKQLMDAGLPIDKGTLQQIWHESNTFSQAEISDLVSLHRLGLPVTEENITQIASYRNLTHQLTAGMEDTAATLTAVLQEMAESGNVEQAAKLYSDILELVSWGAEQDQETISELQPKSEHPPVLEMDQGVRQGKDSLPGLQQNPVSAKEISENQQRIRTAEGQLPTEDTEADKKIQTEEEPRLQIIQKLLKQGLDSKDISLLRSVLHDSKIVELPGKLLLDQWSLRPEDVDSPEKVEQLYQKLGRQLKGLAAALEDNGQSGSNAYQTTVNLSQNVDFLQQINQTYAYIQLPLRLRQGEHKTGELFVYTNKKNLARKDGQISALLHLDMEHLGPLDVYVALQDTRVSTKFYVQKEEILDYLEQNMDALTDRLKKRGYDCKCETNLRTQMQQTAQAMAPLLRAEGSVPVAQYAFDVRT